MLLVDEAGNVLKANPAAGRLLGYSDAEFSGLPVETLVPTRYRTHHHQYRAAYARNPTPRPMCNGQELLALTRDGKEVPVGISLSPLQIEGKQVTLTTLYDAAIRLQLEAQLRASEERLRLAKQAAGLGIYDLDVATGNVQCDELVRNLWGFDPTEAITHDMILAGVHSKDCAAFLSALQRALTTAGNDQYAAEYRIVNRSDKSEHWVSVIGQVIFSEDGHAQRLVGTLRDITERKHSEFRRQAQRAEMEYLIRHQVAVQTASAIAHDINQPLVAISAYSEAAMRMLGSSSVDQHNLQHVLESNVEQAQRAGQVLHELLTFLQGGEPEYIPLNLNALVHEALRIIKRHGYGGFQQLLELEPNLPPVLGNHLQVQKVLVNLLRNGVEAMREAGASSQAITVTVQTAAGKSMAQITVRDTGPGIDAESAARLFSPFFTTKTNGIGLGLATSRSLIEAMGGQLWVDQDDGPGATFHFTLPFAT